MKKIPADIDIQFSGLLPPKIPSPKWFKLTSVSILKILGWKNTGFNLLVVDDRKIQKLNHKFLGHSWPTDVIAFSQLEGKRILTPKGKKILGDVVISASTAERQAIDQHHSLAYELAFLICHGVLHLMGYTDHTKVTKNHMLKKQTQILKKIGIKK